MRYTNSIPKCRCVWLDKKTLMVISITLVILFAGYAILFNEKQLDTNISISGAFALYPLMIEWTTKYHSLHPNIKFEVSAGGAGKGMTDALNNLVDIGMVSREIFAEEIDKGAVWVAVAKDAVVITINSDNPVIEDLNEMGITKDKLISIFINKDITTWGELVNKSEITDTINVYTRSDACGAAVSIAQYMGYNQEDIKGTGVFGDPGLIEAIKNDKYSIGYNNVNYVYDITTNIPINGVTVVPLDINGNGQIDFQEDFYNSRDLIIDAIAIGSYPTPPTRDLNLVTKDKFEGEVFEFIQWILTEGQDMASEFGFVPLSPERRLQELTKLTS